MGFSVSSKNETGRYGQHNRKEAWDVSLVGQER